MEPIAETIAYPSVVKPIDLSGSRGVIRADDPRAEDYSAFLGVRAVLVPDLVTWIQKPVTKIISVADAPLPVDSLLPGRAAASGVG